MLFARLDRGEFVRGRVLESPSVRRCSALWTGSWSVAGATIVFCAALNIVTRPVEFQWAPLPNPVSKAEQWSDVDRRFRSAFDDPKQPIFTRIATISPALVALPTPQTDEQDIVTAEATLSDPAKTLEVALEPAETPSAFAGVWAPKANACAPQPNKHDLLRAVITQDGAWAGEVSCRFRNVRESGNIAVATSTCSDGRQRWTARVRLEVAGDRLIWSSERGVQTYVRCAPRFVEARASI
jgi:hypothetical protein